MSTLVPEDDLPTNSRQFSNAVGMQVPEDDLPNSGKLSIEIQRRSTINQSRFHNRKIKPTGLVALRRDTPTRSTEPAQAVAIGLQKLGIGAEHAKKMEQTIRDSEAKYQALRGENAGRFDGARMIGGAINPINASFAALTPVGSGFGVECLDGRCRWRRNRPAQPIYGDEDFISGKLKQAGIGAATGAAIPAVLGGIARVISPKASVNPNVQLLKKEGVQPTIGQTLGGRWNSLEEKADQHSYPG